MPCSAQRARMLLSSGKAAVLKRYPFTIILKDRECGDVQDLEVKIDPGSKTSGIVLVGNFLKGRKVLWAANLQHRGNAISLSLTSRRALRRSRRHRKTPYRAPRFDNRKRTDGWIAPSLQSRVDHIHTWVSRLQRCSPISSIAVETVRFDTQKLQNPEISGILYQQGECLGYEIREYLLEKWGRKCAYCGKENTRLEIDHIVPKSHGGSDRVSNLIISCKECNSKKANGDIQEFLENKPAILSKILTKSKVSLSDAAVVNATRVAIGRDLRSFNLPLTFWSGGRTKFNRVKQSYEKDHWIDAACVGETGEFVHIDKTFSPQVIRETGKGCRQFCLMDRYGFPRTSAKKQKSVYGFKTGDLARAIVTKGKKSGCYLGRVAVRLSGNFCFDTAVGKVDGINYRYCQNIQMADGYIYSIKKPNKRSSASSHP